MTDEAPIDLQRLDPGVPADLVKGALRRFRVHVVLFTVLAIVVVATLVGWGTKEIVQARNASRLRIEAMRLPPAEATLRYAGWTNCRTPTYEVGSTRVTLLQVGPMSSGGWALHFVVAGGATPLTVQRGDLNGDTFSRSTSLSVAKPPGAASDVLAQPGATWGEVYLAAPPSPDGRLSFHLMDTRQSVVGSFVVNVDEVTHC